MIWAAAFILLFAPMTIADQIREIEESGRIVGIAETASDRLTPEAAIAPGQPPGLIFRAFDSAERGRSAGLGLVIDDAGH